MAHKEVKLSKMNIAKMLNNIPLEDRLSALNESFFIALLENLGLINPKDKDIDTKLLEEIYKTTRAFTAAQLELIHEWQQQGNTLLPIDIKEK